MKFLNSKVYKTSKDVYKFAKFEGPYLPYFEHFAIKPCNINNSKTLFPVVVKDLIALLD